MRDRPADPSGHRGHAGAIAAIYNDAVATSTATFDIGPETVAARERWLAADEHPPVSRGRARRARGGLVGARALV